MQKKTCILFEAYSKNSKSISPEQSSYSFSSRTGNFLSLNDPGMSYVNCIMGSIEVTIQDNCSTVFISFSLWLLRSWIKKKDEQAQSQLRLKLKLSEIFNLCWGWRYGWTWQGTWQTLIKLLQRSVYAALSFSNILRLNLYFPWWGWVGQIKIKDHLSQAEEHGRR